MFFFFCNLKSVKIFFREIDLLDNQYQDIVEDKIMQKLYVKYINKYLKYSHTSISSKTCNSELRI